MTVLALIGYSFRRPQWRIAVPALLVGVVTHRALLSVLTDDAGPIVAVRLASLPLVLGVGFALEDPIHDLARSFPMRYWVARIILVVPSGVLIIAFFLIARAADITVVPMLRVSLFRGIAVELTALAVIGVAAGSLVRAERGSGLHGIVAAGVQLVVFALAWLLPEPLALFADDPLSEDWLKAHYVWLGIIALSAGTFLLASRDMGRCRQSKALRR